MLCRYRRQSSEHCLVNVENVLTFLESKLAIKLEDICCSNLTGGTLLLPSNIFSWWRELHSSV